MERALRDLLTEGVTVYAPSTAANLYGVRSHSTSGSTAAARIVWQQEIIRDIQGQEVPTRGTMWIASTSTGWTQRHRYELPDGTTPTIQTVDRYVDERGSHHYRVRFA